MVGAIVYGYLFYIALVIFVVGFIYRIIKWANIPVPINITTTGSGYIDNPKNRTATIIRMLGEILFFRSLFRNTLYNLKMNKNRDNRFLWLGAIVFHWTFFLIILRHLRFFTEPIPSFIVQLNTLDTIRIFIPSLTFSGLIIVVALLYLFIRRTAFAELRYLSIFSDYFILLLLLAIVITGNLMKYFVRADVIKVKELMLSLLAFKPVAVEIHWLFALHLLLVCVLIAYFPFSKLMHAPGILFSPTRNMINNPRSKRHINPWDYPVEIESRADWEKRFEAEFKDLRKKGLKK